MKAAGFVIFTLRPQNLWWVYQFIQIPPTPMPWRWGQENLPETPAPLHPWSGLNWTHPKPMPYPSSMQPPSPLVLVSRAQGPDIGANFSYSSSLCDFFLFPNLWIFASTPKINLLVSLAHCLLLLTCPLLSAFISRFPDPWPATSVEASVVIHSSATGLDITVPSLWCRKLASCTGPFHHSFTPISTPPGGSWENLCSFWDGVIRHEQIEDLRAAIELWFLLPFAPF